MLSEAVSAKVLHFQWPIIKLSLFLAAKWIFWYGEQVKRKQRMHPWEITRERSKALLAAINALALVKPEDAWLPACVADKENASIAMEPTLTMQRLRQQYILCLARLKLVPLIRGLDDSGTLFMMRLTKLTPA